MPGSSTRPLPSDDPQGLLIAHIYRRSRHRPIVYIHQRSTLIASGYEQLISKLEPRELNSTSTPSRLHIVYVFTGQGSQWYGMARELLESSAVFRDSILVSERILRSLGPSWNLIEELRRGENTTHLDESMIAQPSTTAVQIALVQLYHSLNVIPNKVLGHSSGEIAASYAAGSLSHEAALKLAYYRGLLGSYRTKALCSSGAMLAV